MTTNHLTASTNIPHHPHARVHGAMKTKHTGLTKVKGDATPAKATTTPDVIKSPAQPKELSEQDRDKLGAYLDRSDKPFAVTTVPISRKRKRATEAQVQSDLFGDRLTVQYEVKPANNWESLRRYKKFTGKEDQAMGCAI